MGEWTSSVEVDTRATLEVFQPWSLDLLRRSLQSPRSVVTLTGDSHRRHPNGPSASWSSVRATCIVVVKRWAAGVRPVAQRMRLLPRRHPVASVLRATLCSSMMIFYFFSPHGGDAAAAVAGAGAGGDGDRSGGAGVTWARAPPACAADRWRRWRRRRWRPPPPSRSCRRRRVADGDIAGGIWRDPPARAGGVSGEGLDTDARAGGEGVGRGASGRGRGGQREQALGKDMAGTRRGAVCSYGCGDGSGHDGGVPVHANSLVLSAT